MIFTFTAGQTEQAKSWERKDVTSSRGNLRLEGIFLERKDSVKSPGTWGRNTEIHLPECLLGWLKILTAGHSIYTSVFLSPHSVTL